MCGIVGIFSFDGFVPHRQYWASLVNHLYHRGPDEGAYWADGPFFLGHRRLSIIDLSSGQQPMATADGSAVVVFNGEIYNYLELRRELESLGHNFRTKSDTEVLLHGYTAWGERLPEHLEGMFSFALADRYRRRLFLARDRFGEKPLFVMKTRNYVAFASELRPLAAFPDLNREIDQGSLAGYLLLNYVPGQSTLLRGIERLAPATWKCFSPNSVKSYKYWKPPDKIEDSKRSKEETLEEWQGLFDQTVGMCMRSDVPVGILLSGGIDSCLVAAAAARQGHLSNAYFIDFEDKRFSEYSAASHVAEKLGVPLERTVLRPENLQEFFALVEHADDPLADSSALPMWVLSRMAAQKNKVVLSGDGGDEIYGGYLTYRASLLHHRYVSRLPFFLRRSMSSLANVVPVTEGKVSFLYKVRRFLRAAHLPSFQAHYTWNGTWLPSQACRLVTDPSAQATIREVLREMEPSDHGPARSLLLHLQLRDLANYLPNDILTKSDRMSMAHGLEVRAPFLVHPLAEWALRMPDRFKIGPKGELKALLRAAARSQYGDLIADRPKQGFSIPIHKWVRGPLRGVVQDLLSEEALRAMPFLNGGKVTRLVQEHLSGNRSIGYEIWGLAVLSAWWRSRIMKRPQPPREDTVIERRFDFSNRDQDLSD